MNMSLTAAKKENKTRSPYVFGVLIVVLIIASTFEEVDNKLVKPNQQEIARSCKL